MNPKENNFNTRIRIGDEKAEKRYTLDRLTRYYQEAGHTKAVARALAKNYLRFGKVKA